jgi:methyltransferase (TIGR00027 family)
MFKKDGTAQGVAKQRLIESLAKPSQRVINDPYADRFVWGASLIKLMGNRLSIWITGLFAPGFHEHLIARTRFIDDLVKNCAAKGFEQYVILGAGYDLRAHRLALPPSIKVFEVDQIEVQQRKRLKLSRNSQVSASASSSKDIPNAENVSYVDVDFNQQSLYEVLLAAGFDQSKATVFTLEGVSQYISKEALSATLSEIAKLTQNTESTFFLSYVDNDLDEDPSNCFGEGYPKAAKRAKTIKQLSAKVGEPWISLYSEDEVANLLNQYGFVVEENKSLADLNSAYFGPVGRTLPENNIMKLEYFVRAEKNQHSG